VKLTGRRRIDRCTVGKRSDKTSKSRRDRVEQRTGVGKRNTVLDNKA